MTQTSAALLGFVFYGNNKKFPSFFLSFLNSLNHESILHGIKARKKDRVHE
jgi:hypothetical protein